MAYVRRRPRPYDPEHGYFSVTSYGAQAAKHVPPLHATLGNSKLGKYVMLVSLTPIASCLPKVPCGNISGCYAVKFFKFYKQTRKAYNDNFKLAKDDPVLFGESVRRVLKHVKRIDLFRWWSSGDYPSQAVLDQTIALAYEFPKIPFLAFTKRYDFDFVNVPSNYSIIFSQWPGWTPPRPAPAGVRKAWIDESTFGKNPPPKDPRIPADGFYCPGQCSTCKYCWNIYREGRDVIFEKH